MIWKPKKSSGQTWDIVPTLLGSTLSPFSLYACEKNYALFIALLHVSVYSEYFQAIQTYSLVASLNTDSVCLCVCDALWIWTQFREVSLTNNFKLFWNDPEYCLKIISLIKNEDNILSNPRQIQVSVYAFA